MSDSSKTHLYIFLLFLIATIWILYEFKKVHRVLKNQREQIWELSKVGSGKL